MVDETGPVASQKKPVYPAANLNERQQWILAQMTAGVKLTRQMVEEKFEVSDRTAKRDLGELVDAKMIEYDRGENEGYYRKMK